MCFYSSGCTSCACCCRAAWKTTATSRGPGRCPQCGAELIDAGTGLAVPGRHDTAARRALEAVLRAGLTFHGGCCGTGPGYRPRTPREVRERPALARRTGMPLTKAPAAADPTCADRSAGVTPLNDRPRP
ncbi:hypothetical protein OHS81_04045 [Streptomyces sp. NBC_00400]|uniref:hypothetical protein n=1 Tax=Streptomyces sp. NBC_00400 TaxID=2975737 RepID=UPI002E1B158C